jgi:alpha-glucosidase (family GH31 glycosyl hydrolase)
MRRTQARSRQARRRGAALGIAAAALLVPLTAPGVAQAGSTTAASTDTSPVNLSTKIDMADGVARQGATVVAGDARFEVLTPEVIRLEYSPDGSFLNQPTFTVLDRNLPVPSYTETAENGWLELRTSDEVLRYRLGSGAFTPENTSLRLLHPLPGGSAQVSPTWPDECTDGQSCQSTAATLTGGAQIASNHNGYQSTAGFIAGLQDTGSSASWQVLGATAGSADVVVRYSNNVGALGGPAPRTMSLVVNGTATQFTMPPTASWDDWSTVSVPATLTSGTNTVAVTCASGDDCNVNVDDIAVTPSGGTAASFAPADALGGYLRSFDSANGSYSASPTCTGSESGDTCEASIPSMASGVLDESGWYLLDDTQSDVWTSDGWIAPRPAGDIEDGYLFGYGQDYAGALQALAKLTGPAPLLPEYIFGNWLSRYYPYTDSDYENEILPEFKANGTSLDTLSIDTDWKSPNTWDGWEWNPSLFSDPQTFLSWAKSQGIHVDLNVHSSISLSDPEYAEAQAIAGGTLQSGGCNTSGGCDVWDWSNVAQAESNFALQQPLYDDGVDFTWLDWCCDGSDVTMPGVTPDSWINHLYAQQMVNAGERGFDLSRIGASLQNSVAGSYSTGAWADHRSAIAFTGDTWSTWNTLAQEAQLAQDEASIGEPYVSDDIGGFLGAPNGGSNDPDDLYLRWLQLGTFQPIMREHSNSGQNARLPWEYDSATQAIGDQFLQLREQLVPYTYTLAQQASSTGLPMTQPLYLDYPDQSAAYQNPTEYMLGQDMLVAPVTTPGQVAKTTVWIPPGTWTDWFTGATFQGPSTQTLEVPDSRMPVFVKAGGIVPLQPATAQAENAGSSPLTLRVFDGGDGSYSMYDDAGTGLGYEHGQSTKTPITSSVAGDTTTVRIGAAAGSYPGAPSSRSYTVDLVDLSAPHLVLENGRPLPSSDWSYNAGTHTLQVSVGAVPTNRSATITQVGGAPVRLDEPAATALTIDPANGLNVAPGSTTTVSSTFTDSGPGAADDVQLELNVPAGWQATATTPTGAGSVDAGGTLTASWTVTAPAASSGQVQAATLSSTATYTDAVTGQAVADNAEQVPTPAITSVSPSTASAGDVVTVTGSGFGATQGGNYLTFSDDGTNWGAPPDEATFTIDSWSDDKITFTVPEPSGTNGTWHVDPGSTATITVTSSLGTVSNTGTLAIGS